jgi:hypothetical protein
MAEISEATPTPGPFAPLSLIARAKVEPIRLVVPPDDDWTPLMPAPEGMTPPTSPCHLSRGMPAKSWVYTMGTGEIAFAVYRFDYVNEKGQPDKDTIPMTYGTKAGRVGWHWKAPPTPSPLYRLPELIKDTTKPILVVEGEKTADAAAILFPEYAVTTWQGGSNAVHKADWLDLTERTVLIWPDNDRAGLKAADDIVHEISAADVRIVPVPEAWPEGWDLADPLPDGVTMDTLRSLLADSKPAIEVVQPPSQISLPQQVDAIRCEFPAFGSGPSDREDFEGLDDESEDEESESGEDIDPDLARRVREMRMAAKAEREAILKEFNEQYAVVNDNGTAMIFSDRFDDILKRHLHQRMSVGAFNVLYANRWVCTRVTEKGKRIRKKVAQWWFEHPKRRQFIHGVVFDPSGAPQKPGVLNLWRGFAYEAQPGSWDKLKEHICVNLCQGNEEHFAYLMGWLARLVQHPALQGEVAVVLRGSQGTGKGTLGQALRALFGQHGMHIASSKHLVGNFNAHLRDCVFLFADEAFFAGDKASLCVLKSLVTEPALAIEPKGVDVSLCPNRLHILMASNSDWVVPAAVDERRFFVLDVSDDRRRDTAYFGAIKDELQNGGYEAMLHDLLHYDLSEFNVRDVPETRGLQTQKKRSLDVKYLWWQDVLQRGYVFQSQVGLEEYFGEWHDVVSTEVVYASYLAFAKGRERQIMSREDLGSFMREMGCKSTRPQKGVIGEHIAEVENKFGGTKRTAELVRKDRPPSYRLGSLEAARTAFEAATRLTIQWEGDHYDEPPVD